MKFTLTTLRRGYENKWVHYGSGGDRNGTDLPLLEVLQVNVIR